MSGDPEDEYRNGHHVGWEEAAAVYRPQRDEARADLQRVRSWVEEQYGLAVERSESDAQRRDYHSGAWLAFAAVLRFLDATPGDTSIPEQESGT